MVEVVVSGVIVYRQDGLSFLFVFIYFFLMLSFSLRSGDGSGFLGTSYVYEVAKGKSDRRQIEQGEDSF